MGRYALIEGIAGRAEAGTGFDFDFTVAAFPFIFFAEGMLKNFLIYESCTRKYLS
jgi:hypothetical protein